MRRAIAEHLDLLAHTIDAVEAAISEMVDEFDIHEHPAELRDDTFCPDCFLHHHREESCTRHQIEASDAFLGLTAWDRRTYEII
jgi:hypothetical protein